MRMNKIPKFFSKVSGGELCEGPIGGSTFTFVTEQRDTMIVDKRPCFVVVS